MDPEKLRESSQFRLLNLISSINGNGAKDLAIHGDLMKPLDQVVGARKLRYISTNLHLQLFYHNHLFTLVLLLKPSTSRKCMLNLCK